MTANAKTTGQEAEKKGFLNRLSFRKKVIGGAALVFLVLLIYSIPGDRNELLTRQERVETAQIAYDLAFPAVAPIMDVVIASLEDTEIDLTDNQSFTRLSNAVEVFNRTNSTIASRFQAVVTFSGNVHSLLDGTNAVAELDTVEFRTLVAEMDTTLGVAFIALMELNVSIDDYNRYHKWISAKVASTLFDLPEGYDDPVPPRSRLNSESLDQ